MGLSPLRAHKFKYNFNDTEDPFCLVCETIEDTEHFLLHCSSFRLTRVDLFQSVSNITSFSNLNTKRKIHLLLYGDEKINAEKNRSILDEVGNFIHKSKRLDGF